MCGIFALLCHELPEDMKAVVKSSNYLSNRGPDKSVSIIKKSGVYVFKRLSICDASSTGDQPMVDGDVLMMCNGEIYNHKELEEEFEIKCESSSDCEIILRLYQKIGFVEMVKRLDGVYAIVLVDKDIVYMARDRIGVRPLYYGQTKQGVWVVASEPPALTDLCQQVHPFLPGTCARYRKGDSTFPDYIHSTELVVKDEVYDSPDTVIRETLINAVKKRLMTDRPIGCLLSGGLDSSLVTAILVKLLGAENVRTYSVGMVGSTDLQYARKVVDFLGTQHTEIIFTPQDGFDIIPDVVKALASYDITTIRASVGMYRIAKYISETTKDRVIFSGEGSDELFCGYLYFHNSPDPRDSLEESVRLMKRLHEYDVLRADRTISVNGLELRVPFLDKDMIKLSLSLGEYKLPKDGYEKHLLRTAFDGYLPDEVLWRRKEGFSDGVSGLKKSWYSHIQDFVEDKISDEDFAKSGFISKEALYYKQLFDSFYPNYELKLDYWMPKWTDTKDPSGRMLSAFDEKDGDVEENEKSGNDGDDGDDEKNEKIGNDGDDVLHETEQEKE